MFTNDRISSYQILSSIGAGGMGEVYRARDTKLNRDVAIKILPSEFSSDEEKLERLRREAQTLASLNHPNIAQIYGFEETNGSCALVMEFIEGDELTRRMQRGPVPMEEAIPIAKQVAEALEAAHEKGIVHRDLKPANIKETSSGQIKLLDFGLATAVMNPSGSFQDSDVSQSPTMAKMTHPGMILGTAAYMSPEQARGKSVDKRADIWAFGVILFEMVAGRKLFGGETISDILVAVLKNEIDWKLLPEETPQEIVRLLRRCLERDPVQRLRDIGEARIALSQPPAKMSATTKSSSALWLWIFVLSGIVFLAGWFASTLLRTGRTTALPAISQESFTLLTDQPGVESQPSLSPDGHTLAYVKDNNGQDDIYVVRVGGRNSQNLTADCGEDDESPAFSPDGDSIAFRSDRSGGGIFVMGSTGESVRRVSDFGFNPSWSPDGKSLVVSTASFFYPQFIAGVGGELFTINLQTGEKRQITSSSGFGAIQPAWSPNGKRIAYWVSKSGYRDLKTIAADGSEMKTEGVPVTDDKPMDWDPVWSPDGTYLYFSSNRGGTLNLWRIPIEQSTGKAKGQPEAVTAPTGWAGYVSFAHDGKLLAFASLDWRSSLLKVPFNDQTGKISGSPVPILESSYPVSDHSISPDGKSVAYTAITGGAENLFVARIDGTDIRKLTDDPNRARGPGWSYDSQWIAFQSDRGGVYETWMIRPDGSGPKQVTHNGGRGGISSLPMFFSDGKKMVVTAPKLVWGILNLETGQVSSMPEPAEKIRFWPFSLSPDETRLVGTAVSLDGVLRGVMTFSLTDKHYQPQTTVKSAFWVCERWLNDSKRFLYRNRHGVYLYDTVRQSSEPLFPVGGLMLSNSLGVTPDNRYITYSQTATEGDIWMMTLSSAIH